MKMLDAERADLERKIHALMCGSLDAQQSNELLLRIANDDEVRALLAEMVEVQTAARAALGYDCADETIQTHRSRLLAALETTSTPALSPVSRRPSTFRRFRRSVSLFRIAAAMALLVSSYWAYSAYNETRTMRKSLVEISLTNTDLVRYRKAWDQLSGNSDSWILLAANGQGEFGKVPLGPQPASDDTQILVMQFRVLDKSGQCVYRKDLLVPDKPRLYFKLDNIGDIAGQPASLAVAKSTNQALIRLAVGGKEVTSTGILERVDIGTPASKVGTFHLNDQELRLFVTAERLGASWG